MYWRVFELKMVENITEKRYVFVKFHFAPHKNSVKEQIFLWLHRLKMISTPPPHPPTFYTTHLWQTHNRVEFWGEKYYYDAMTSHNILIDLSL